MGQITIEKNVAGIEGLCVITPAVHGDNRGYFMETYSQRDMEEAGININFVQDNQSMSTKGVLRGLHFQKHFPQTKLVRAIKGAVFDVAVDLRTDSETYGKWYLGISEYLCCLVLSLRYTLNSTSVYFCKICCIIKCKSNNYSIESVCCRNLHSKQIIWSEEHNKKL